MSKLFFAAVDFDQPLDGWNTSMVEDMEDLFAYCTVFDQDLNSWDVSKVTNMKGAFRFAEEFNGGKPPGSSLIREEKPVYVLFCSPHLLY